LQVAVGDGAQVIVSAPSKFYRDWVARNYSDAFVEAFAAVGTQSADISFQVDEERQRELFAREDEASTTASPREDGATNGGRQPAVRVGNLLPAYTFENFVVGPSNEFAHAAARAVANRPGEKYNPLFIYGGVGVGKTHLVNAIGHAVLAKNPFARIVYVASERFVNDMISSLRRDRMDDFKRRFRKVDLLIIDDVQFLAGRERTQEEFFHTFNSVHEAHHQIVLTSDKYPKDIPDLEERLRNRFEWGLTADVQAPELETRLAILQKKAESEGFALPTEVGSFVASQITSNVRELEGALTRLAAMASLHGADVTVEFAAKVLEPYLKDRTPSVTIDDVQRAVCDRYGLTLSEMKSKRRTQNVASARQVAMYLARKLVSASYPQIGNKFGGRDHTTVMHAQEAVKRRLESDPSLRSTIDGLERDLGKRPDRRP
jgi:chromosomal replication initiator protein